MILLEIGTALVPYYTRHAYGHACKQTHFDVKSACELPCTGGWYDAFYKARRTNSGMQSMQPLTPYRLSAQCLPHAMAGRGDHVACSLPTFQQPPSLLIDG